MVHIVFFKPWYEPVKFYQAGLTICTGTAIWIIS